PRRIWSAPARPAGGARRACLEDAAFQQGAARSAMGAALRPPEPAADLSHAAEIRCGLRKETAAIARGGERRDSQPRRRACRTWRIRRRGLHLPGSRTAPGVRRPLPGDRLVDRRRAVRRHGNPRGRFADYQEHEPLRATLLHLRTDHGFHQVLALRLDEFLIYAGLSIASIYL